MKRYLRFPRWIFKTCTRGFSLVELCVVLALVAIIASLAATQGRFFDRLLVRSQLEQLYTTVLYLQRLAMATHSEQHLIFDQAHNTYRHRDTQYRLSRAVVFGAAPGIKGPPSSPSHQISDPITFTNATITCYPDGVIKSGTVYLTDRDLRYTYALSCGVSQVSHVRMYQYDNRWRPL